MNSKPVTRQFEDSDLHQELVTFEVPNNDLKELIFYFSHMKYHTAKTYLHWLRSWNEWYQANAGKEGNEAWPASSLPVTQPRCWPIWTIFRARCHTAALKVVCTR